MAESGLHDCPPFMLQTLYNIRDLGGHATAEGRWTRCGRFVRADAPVRLSQSDLDALLAYPVRQVIDLRSQNEISLQPNCLRDQPLVQYHNIPLLGKNIEQDIVNLQKKNAQNSIKLVDLYFHILDQSRTAIGAVLHTMTQAEEGVTLFHCTHGKDRTGIMTALLLSLAGVASDRIIEDYQASEIQLRPWFNTFMQDIPETDRHFFTTPASYMKKTLQHLKKQHGSVQAYLELCGVDKDQQAQLKRRLLDL